MLGDALDDEAQISLWIKAVELRRADQAIDSGGALAPSIGTREQEILAPQGNRSQRTLSGVVIHLDQAIAGVPDERWPQLQGLADRLGQGRLT